MRNMKMIVAKANDDSLKNRATDVRRIMYH